MSYFAAGFLCGILAASIVFVPIAFVWGGFDFAKWLNEESRKKR